MRGQGIEVRELAYGLGMTRRDLNQMWRAFKSFDVDNSAGISVAELIVIGRLEEAETFGRLVFRLWDSDGNGSIDFAEFLSAVWSIASANHESLCVFTHQLFDFDANNSLDAEELAFVGNVLWGFRPTKQVSTAIARLDRNSDGAVSAAEFVDRTRGAGTLLSPAFSLMHFLCEFTLGKARWEHLAEIRLQIYGSKSIFDIFDLQAREIRRMKSRPLDLVRDLSTSQGSSVPPSMAEKLSVAHEMVKHNRKKSAKGKDSLKTMQRAAIRLANTGTQAVFAKDKSRKANYRDATHRALHGGGSLPETIDEDSVQLKLDMRHELPELPPLRQNLVNRSSAAISIYQAATGSAPVPGKAVLEQDKDKDKELRRRERRPSRSGGGVENDPPRK